MLVAGLELDGLVTLLDSFPREVTADTLPYGSSMLDESRHFMVALKCMVLNLM